MKQRFSAIEKKKPKVAKGPKGPVDTIDFNFLTEARKGGGVRRATSSFFLGEKGGAVVLGGIDSRFHVGPIQYHPAMKKVSGAWALEVDSFRMSGTEICKHKCLALVDTGTTMMVLPSSATMQIDGAVSNPWAKRPVECQGDATAKINGQRYTIGAGQWCGQVAPMGDRIQGQLKVLTPDKSFAKHTWIVLGEAFIKSFYTVFDNDDASKPRIGFAPVCKQSHRLCANVKAQHCTRGAVRRTCPITCKQCGASGTQELFEAQFDP